MTLFGTLIFPFTSSNRQTLLYNIKTRLHPFYNFSLIFKILSISMYYCMTAYWILSRTSFFYILSFYGLYLFAFAPSVFHLIYLLLCLQKSIRDLPIISNLSNTCKMIVAFVITGIFLGLFVFLFFQKNINFYYILGSAFVYQIFSSISNKRHFLWRFIWYDFLLTAVLSVFSMLVPVANFSPISYRQCVVFWSIFIFVAAQGYLLT